MPNLILWNSDDWLGGCWFRGAGKTFGDGNGSTHSRILGSGTRIEIVFPRFQNRNEKNAFPNFGNGNGNEKSIPNFREQDWKAGIPGNGREREFPLTHAAVGVSQQKHTSLSNQGECNLICVHSALNLIQIKHNLVR